MEKKISFVVEFNLEMVPDLPEDYPWVALVAKLQEKLSASNIFTDAVCDLDDDELKTDSKQATIAGIRKWGMSVELLVLDNSQEERVIK